MGGTDDAHIDGLFLRAAQWANLALLNGAQQLGLHGQRQVADFVQEQGAALGCLEVARPVLRGAGIGAFACAKEFGFEQIFGNGAAIDGDQWPVGSLAAGMQSACDQLLARA